MSGMRVWWKINGRWEHRHDRQRRPEKPKRPARGIAQAARMVNGFIRSWLLLKSDSWSQQCTCSNQTKQNNQKLRRPQVCPETGLTRRILPVCIFSLVVASGGVTNAWRDDCDITNKSLYFCIPKKAPKMITSNSTQVLYFSRNHATSTSQRQTLHFLLHVWQLQLLVTF